MGHAPTGASIASESIPATLGAGCRQQAHRGVGAWPTGADPGEAWLASGYAPVAAATLPVVDVEAVLEDLARKNPQKLNWRTSIVDLMKLVGMESSLAERKELAKELGYTGSTTDTATMNIWLHKQVLNKLAENGGKVPADLLK